MFAPAGDSVRLALVLAPALGLVTPAGGVEPARAQELAAPVYPGAVPDARNERPDGDPALYYTAAPLAEVVAFYRDRGATVAETGEAGERVTLHVEPRSTEDGEPAAAPAPGSPVRVVVEGRPAAVDGAVRRALARARAPLERAAAHSEGAEAVEKRRKVRELEERYEELAELFFPHAPDGEGELRSTAAILYEEYRERTRELRLMDPGSLREEARRRAREERIDPALLRILEAAAEGEPPGRAEIWSEYLDRVEAEGFTTRLRIPRPEGR